ncbi:MAG: hypothetical protein KY468_15965 [Armatimonadetes bacterium]|nr:hypothetical protein [Armatimonadota bacterium]
MNQWSQALFDSFAGGIDTYIRLIGKDIRSIIDADSLAPDEHKALNAAIRKGLEDYTDYALGRFDNIGCSLPKGVLGYRILAEPCIESDDEIERLPEVEIREGDQDYAVMWRDYLFMQETEHKSHKQRDR